MADEKDEKSAPDGGAGDLASAGRPSAPRSPWAPDPEEIGVYSVEFAYSTGQAVLFPARTAYRPLVEALHDDGFELCADLTAVDYLAHPGRRLPEAVTPERFEVVVSLLSLSRRQRVRIRVQVPEAEPVVDSLFRIYPGSEAQEREAFDMFGIVFADHPDLTRILMPEDWEGHPLRKDYSLGRVPVQFKAAPSTR